MESNLKIDCLINGELETNTYFLISKDKKAIIVDPADGKMVLDYLKGNGLIPEKIVNTHGHYDHISGNLYLKNYFDIPICVGVKDYDFLMDPELNMSYYIGDNYISPQPEVLLDEGYFLYFGEEKIMILSTPGHTPGSITLKIGNNIISGDLIFKEGIGRTDLFGGDYKSIIESIKKIFSNINYETKIFPGHGFFGEAEQFSEILKEFNIRI
ncbi:MAG: MBL fold metallo-hydrolase [candidate division WOR-3 bacterium]